MLLTIQFVIFSVCYCDFTEGARILGVFLAPSYSHSAVFRPYIEELANRGHELVIVTPDPRWDGGKVYQNITQIDTSSVYSIKRKHMNKFEEGIAKWNRLSFLDFYFNYFNNIVDYELSLPEVQMLIKDKSQKFDLVIVEWIGCSAIIAFAERFNAPLVGISSTDATSIQGDPLGNPSHPIISPDRFLPYDTDLTFIERVKSVSFYFLNRYKYYYKFLPDQNQIARRHFGKDIPYIGDIANKVQLLLMNCHEALGFTAPKVPAIVFLGSMHIRSKKPLPTDLKNYLDSATKGVIYFSLGSNVQGSKMSNETREIFLTAFEELPYKVLWKWETETMPWIPENVKLSNWVPQQDVLGHRNVKLFITQGGQQSMEEAIHNGVTLLGIPLGGDQNRNVQKFRSLNIGDWIELRAISKQRLKSVLIKLINNEKYKQSIIALRRVLYDQPQTSVEKATWWTEHILRHKGARHLRSRAKDVPLYQYLLLDVVGLYVVVLLIIGAAVRWTIKYVISKSRWICSNNAKKLL